MRHDLGTPRRLVRAPRGRATFPASPTYPNALIDEYTTPGVAAGIGLADAEPIGDTECEVLAHDVGAASQRPMITAASAALTSSSIERLPALIHVCHGIADLRSC